MLGPDISKLQVLRRLRNKDQRLQRQRQCLGHSVLVPRPPPAPPSPPPRILQVIAEVVEFIRSVLMQITVLQQEIKQIASNIQQLKEQKYAGEKRWPGKGVHVSIEDFQVDGRCSKRRKIDQ